MDRQFLDKKDSNFTEQQTKDILNHLLKEYLDDGSKNMKMTFDEMISATANDLGISKDQIHTAFSHPKATKKIADLEYSHTQLLQADKNLIAHLNKPFTFKDDLEFSPQERKDILTHYLNNYSGKREYELRKFEDTIQGVANDLGLTSKQVRAALSAADKNTFKELEITHNKLVKNNFKTLKYIETAGYPKVIKFLKLTPIWTWIKKIG